VDYSRFIQNIVLKKLMHHHAQNEHATPGIVVVPENRHPNHLRQFFKMAEVRKRQMLEKMLMDHEQVDER
jgi:hypothetical protein